MSSVRALTYGGVLQGVGSQLDWRRSSSRLRRRPHAVELEVYEVPGKPWRAVLGELPSSWFAGQMFDIDIVAASDGEEIGRENLLQWSS